MVAKKHRLWKKIVIGLLLFLVIVIGGSYFWLGHGAITPAKEKIFRVLPYPLALVNGKPILMSDYLFRLETLKKFYSQEPNANLAQMKQDLYQAMVEETKIQILADSKGVIVTKKEIDSEYNFESGQSGEENFNNSLKTYGLDKTSFKNVVIKPSLLATNLNVWFNKQENLNPQAYQAEIEVQTKLAKDQTLESLAGNYSQDKSSSQLQGDLGFVNSSGLLPELLAQLDAMQVGNTQALVSRFGLHIIKLEEKDNSGPGNGERFHLKQIFIQTSGFESWVKQQTEKYKIKKLINI